MGFVDVMKYAMGLPGIRRIVPSIVGRYETYVTKELRKFGTLGVESGSFDCVRGVEEDRERFFLFWLGMGNGVWLFV